MYVVYMEPTSIDNFDEPVMIAAFLMRSDATTFLNSQTITTGYKILEVSAWEQWTQVRTKMNKALDKVSA